MDTAVTKRVEAKLFVGCPITSEIRMHLNESVLWKQAAIDRGYPLEHLVEVHYHEKEYLGIYLSESSAQVSRLKKIAEFVEEKIKSYCPELPASQIKITLFPQIFIR